MKNYDKLPTFLTVKFRGKEYEMEPAIIGSFGNMRLVYTDGPRVTVLYERIKNQEELEWAIESSALFLNSIDEYAPMYLWKNGVKI